VEKPSVTPTSLNKAVRASKTPTALNQVGPSDATGTLFVTGEKTSATAEVHKVVKPGAIVDVQQEQAKAAKSISPQKLAANRRNAKLSSGPRTKQGKKWSRRNAVKHGILTSALLFEDSLLEEAVHFRELFYVLREDFQPVGQIEELLVERIAVCWWRLQRALRFEAVVIELESDDFQSQLIKERNVKPAEIVQLIEDALKEANEKRLQWIYYPAEKCQQECMKRLERIRGAEDSERRFEAEVLRKAKAMGLEAIYQPDAASQPAGASATQTSEPDQWRPLVLPAEKDLNRILRYEASIHRQLAHSMNQLERLQRARKGEHVPAPVSLQVSSDE